mmetsp:Transcript_28256/g.34905  ORF Transcript_28256/g.34905 Transcript_28256/m.34905 type:complete len:89 (-) Transcript_28256:312-578(-)
MQSDKNILPMSLKPTECQAMNGLDIWIVSVVLSDLYLSLTSSDSRRIISVKVSELHLLISSLAAPCAWTFGKVRTMLMTRRKKGRKFL